MTEWRAVVGYEGLYEVSNVGDVRSVDHVLERGTLRQRTHRGRLLKAYARFDVNRPTGGHRRVTLSRNGVVAYKYIHRLVLEAFVGPCPEKHEGCHRDDDCENNSVSNLYWGTRKQNMADALRNGRIGAA